MKIIETIDLPNKIEAIKFYHIEWANRHAVCWGIPIDKCVMLSSHKQCHYCLLEYRPTEPKPWYVIHNRLRSTSKFKEEEEAREYFEKIKFEYKKIDERVLSRYPEKYEDTLKGN